MDFVDFPFRISKLKININYIKYINFHIDLGKFLGDWACIIQRL